MVNYSVRDSSMGASQIATVFTLSLRPWPLLSEEKAPLCENQKPSPIFEVHVFTVESYDIGYSQLYVVRMGRWY